MLKQPPENIEVNLSFLNHTSFGWATIIAVGRLLCIQSKPFQRMMDYDHMLFIGYFTSKIGQLRFHCVLTNHEIFVIFVAS
jgi:hypothetical protein